MTTKLPSGPDAICVPGSSGINIIIVGAGIAGLSAAIECHRKGHVVTVYEKASGLRKVGDSITLSRNGARVVAKWGNGEVHDALNKLRAHASCVEIRDGCGQFLGISDLSPYQEGEGYVVSRPGLVEVFYNHARDLGIAIHHDCRVTDYWETETEAGIIINGKERVGADCVVHADGAHSRARAFVAGEDPKPTSSGCAILRACFDSSLLRDDCEASWILDQTGDKDSAICFVGDDGSDLVVGTLQHGAKVLWICTHQDTSTARESWSTPSDMKDVLAKVRRWPCWAKLDPIVRHTPEHLVVNYHLFTRPPLNRWVSTRGRMILIGDAAHPYSPKAGQGACQAIEDAAVVAVALELAGPENVPLGLRVVEKVRYIYISVTLFFFSFLHLLGVSITNPCRNMHHLDTHEP
jgi:2-polyprenyl-6-methoxyphenol hydroxylase-like FAD-dependent oxidoreductase